MRTSPEIPPTAQAGKYVSFLVSSREYAVGILQVQEINGSFVPNPVPGAPDGLLGVVEQRGQVIPVVNLRRIFGLEAEMGTAKQSFILMEGPYQERQVPIGILVDEVIEILNLGRDKIRPLPSREKTPPCVVGTGKHNGKELFLIDVDKLFGSEPIKKILQAVHSGEGQ
jgi:purine-binding chemotaxis protein CheW